LTYWKWKNWKASHHVLSFLAGNPVQTTFVFELLSKKEQS